MLVILVQVQQFKEGKLYTLHIHYSCRQVVQVTFDLPVPVSAALSEFRPLERECYPVRAAPPSHGCSEPGEVIQDGVAWGKGCKGIFVGSHNQRVWVFVLVADEGPVVLGDVLVTSQQVLSEVGRLGVVLPGKVEL